MDQRLQVGVYEICWWGEGVRGYEGWLQVTKQTCFLGLCLSLCLLR